MSGAKEVVGKVAEPGDAIVFAKFAPIAVEDASIWDSRRELLLPVEPIPRVRRPRPWMAMMLRLIRDFWQRLVCG
jgi:hypothetical protein